jgi:uncharacterized protein YndB with AHSA1/START domain
MPEGKTTMSAGRRRRETRDVRDTAMSAQPHATVCVAHHFDAPPERVFDAWLDPDKTRYWFAPGLGEVVRVEIHARVGGLFSIVQRRNGKEVDHRGEYITIDRPRQLAFTWGVPQDSPDTARVVVDIVPAGLGSNLTLSHELHPAWAGFASRAEETWLRMLEAMDETLR